MRIRRRTFIFGTGLMAAAPTLANLLSGPAVARLPSWRVAEPLPPRPAAGGTRAHGPVLRIEGWDVRDDAPVASAGDEVWISISQSWRSAWR